MKTKQNGTSLFDNSLIWFGAALSIAEILTGTYLAPLGMKEGLLAILVGHGIGGLLLWGAGLIGTHTRKSAMETVKLSFGQKGCLLFAALNVLQLLGWTGIMIYDGALAANGVFPVGNAFWCVLIGALIILWLMIGIRNLGKVNTLAMGALFVMTVILSFMIFGKEPAAVFAPEAMSFGAAVELAVAMPLSWLPLVADYTREAADGKKAAAVSALSYSVVSCWMYIIGLGAALYTGQADIAAILKTAGLGAVGLLIVVFSTVTTTFLDAWSAGVSTQTICHKLPEKHTAIAVTVLGVVGALCLPLYDITNFLYFIGSVFAPMIAIQLADFFLLKQDRSRRAFAPDNLILWLLGFVAYRLLMRVDFILGSTVPAMVFTIVLCILWHKGKKVFQK